MQSVNAADKPVDHRVIKFFEREASRPQRIPHSGAAAHTHGSGGRRLRAEVGGGCGLPVPGDVGLRRDSPDSCYSSRSASSRARPTAWFREETPSFR